jgi:hypothetical protein
MNAVPYILFFACTILQTLAKGAAISTHGARDCSGECMMKMYLSGTERLRVVICSGGGSRWLTV